MTFVGVLEVKDIKLKLVNFGTRKNSEDIKMSNAMSDSLSSTSSEPRMLERRIRQEFFSFIPIFLTYKYIC